MSENQDELDLDPEIDQTDQDQNQDELDLDPEIDQTDQDQNQDESSDGGDELRRLRLHTLEQPVAPIDRIKPRSTGTCLLSDYAKFWQSRLTYVELLQRLRKFKPQLVTVHAGIFSDRTTIIEIKNGRIVGEAKGE